MGRCFTLPYSGIFLLIISAKFLIHGRSIGQGCGNLNAMGIGLSHSGTNTGNLATLLNTLPKAASTGLKSVSGGNKERNTDVAESGEPQGCAEIMNSTDETAGSNPNMQIKIETGSGLASAPKSISASDGGFNAAILKNIPVQSSEPVKSSKSQSNEPQSNGCLVQTNAGQSSSAKPESTQNGMHQNNEPSGSTTSSPAYSNEAQADATTSLDNSTSNSTNAGGTTTTELPLRDVSKNAKYVKYEDVNKAKDDPEIVIIDVRNSNEVENSGLIPGSANIPLDEVRSAFGCLGDGEFLDKYCIEKPTCSEEIIFTGDNGKGSEMAMFIVLRLNFTNVACYSGGWNDWIQHNGKECKKK